MIKSNIRQFKVWNIDTYELVKTTKFISNAAKLFLNLNFNSKNLLLVAGLDLKLYDHNLDLIDEYFRKTNENSIKNIVGIENDRFVVASNYDLESYLILISKSSLSNENRLLDEEYEEKIKLKEVQKYKNAHKDSILCLTKISGII